ncbi:MAG TPA: protein-disulfide reductase DsbD domain-containing protein [Vicinamibacterales bacterium]|nr:protein-disulfide reductase DsbD domain-containing protein [Vicinamibacterales bacterium]
MPILIAVATVVLAAAFGQLPAQNSTAGERVSVTASTQPDSAGPGESVSLLVEITPKDDMRVFAPGARDFTAVSLSFTAPRGFSIGKPKYPVPERQTVPGTKRQTPVYDSRFQLEQPITISKRAKPGDTVRIVGSVTYQVCDERTTFAKSSAPVFWTVNVR